jgi:hypothetical protein
MRRKAFSLALAVLLPGISSAGVGRSAVQTLLQPVSARPAALGDAYSAEAAGADSIGYNPAGLALGTGPELLLQYHGGLMGDTFLNAGYAQQFGNIGLGASVLSYNSGGVDLVNRYGIEVTATGQRDIAYSLGAGMRLPWAGLSAGVAARYVTAQVVEEFSGEALAGDAGIRFDLPDTGFSLAAAAENIGTGIKIADGESHLPSVLRAGAAYRLDFEAEESRMAGMEGIMEPSLRGEPAPHRLSVLCDAIFRLGDRISSLALGAEFSFHRFFAVRAGIRAPMHGTGTRNMAGSAGIGAKIRRVSMDYAVEMTSTAPLHRVSMAFMF